MVTWKEYRLFPIMDSVHVVEGYDNPCETCENWGYACESCNVSVPVISDFRIKEVTIGQMTICGIPVGNPFEVKEYENR